MAYNLAWPLICLFPKKKMSDLPMKFYTSNEKGDPPDIRSERSNSATDDGIGNHRSDTGGNKSDLDDLLDYIAGEIKGVGAPGDVSRSQR